MQSVVRKSNTAAPDTAIIATVAGTAVPYTLVPKGTRRKSRPLFYKQVGCAVVPGSHPPPVSVQSHLVDRGGSGMVATVGLLVAMTAVAARPRLRHTCNGRHGGSGRRTVIDEVAIMVPETGAAIDADSARGGSDGGVVRRGRHRRHRRRDPPDYRRRGASSSPAPPARQSGRRQPAFRLLAALVVPAGQARRRGGGGAPRRAAAAKAAGRGTLASGDRDNDEREGDGVERRPWGGGQQSVVGLAASRRTPARAAARRGMTTA